MSSAIQRAGHAAIRPISEQPLAVTVTAAPEPVSPDHRLLVGFHFGATSGADEHPAIVSPGVEPINRDSLYECWWHRGDVDHTTRGDVRIAQCEDYAVAVLQRTDAPPGEFEACTYEAYAEIMSAVRATRHGHLVKIWNYFPGINEGDGDQEKYRQFSVGRARVFEEQGVFDDTVPTGTAVGCVRAAGLSIIALVSKHGLRAAENPRQVSAFKYPRQYGPKSPKFSRGGFVAAANHELFLLSGTAAIVGHESAHPFDVALQTEETLHNLEHLCQALSALPGAESPLTLDKDSVLRVYLRDAADRDLVAGRLQELLGDTQSNVVYLHADICRRELMVEIDGVRVLA